MNPVPQAIRTLHVITDLRLGGAERMLVKLAARLPRLGVGMEVVSLGGRGALGDEIARAGVALHTLGLGSLAGLPAATLRLARIIRAYDPDVVQTWMYHADLVGLLANRVAGRRPLAWNVRCSDIALSRRTEQLRRVLARLSAHPSVVLANARTGITTHAALGYRPRRTAVIPNGFDLDEFRPDAASRSALRETLGIAGTDILIGKVARVAPMKDHDTFLQAAAIAAARREDLVFALVGPGTEPDSPLGLRAAELGLGRRLHLLGPRRDIAQLWNAFDIATLSSSSGEGFPNVIGEAMASAVPCVATDVGDVAEVLGGTGIIVPPRSPQALAEGWLAIAALDAEERRQRGERARARVAQHFQMDVIASRYAELYRELAATRGAD